MTNSTDTSAAAGEWQLWFCESCELCGAFRRLGSGAFSGNCSECGEQMVRAEQDFTWEECTYDEDTGQSAPRPTISAPAPPAAARDGTAGEEEER